jgi:hypothetical protein
LPGFPNGFEKVEEDPLFATGLRRKITILEWKQVFADGEVLAG